MAADEVVAVAVRFPGEWFDVREFVTPCQIMVVEDYSTIVTRDINEDQAILDCWSWVIRNIAFPGYVNGMSDYHKYEAYTSRVSGTTVPIVSHVVTREFWDWPYEILGSLRVLGKGVSDCQGSSCVLVSLLRNFLPECRVNVAIGNIGDSGHAWVRVERRGMWFVLESTLNVLPSEPWKAEVDASGYDAKLIFNDVLAREIQPIDYLLPVRHELARKQVSDCWGARCA